MMMRCLSLSALTVALVVTSSVPAFADSRCPVGARGAVFAKRHGGAAKAARALRRLLTRDQDRDGLPSCLERTLGLSPRRADSDADGIDDADELSESGKTFGDMYDDGELDSDDDGLSDADESVSDHRRVYLSDSDDDGLLDGEDDEDDSDDEDEDGEEDEDHLSSSIGMKVLSLAAPVVSVQAKKKCRKKATVARLARNPLSLKRLAVKKCKKKRKPSATPKPTPGDSTPKPTAKPTPRPTSTPSGGGNAAAGHTAWNAKGCNTCHGVKAGKNLSQLQSAMAMSQHAAVKNMLSSADMANIAAYLMSL